VKRPRRLFLATGNPSKRAELVQLLAGIGVEIVPLAGEGAEFRVEEDGTTLEANALKKARAGSFVAGFPAVADDTGLFVAALGGEPGVRSARYAGPDGDAGANCAKLQDALRGVPSEGRGAEFRCVVALAAPAGEEHVFEGSCPGRIAERPRGTGGFGYDSLFEAGDSGRTFAEMSPGEKHGWSHRGRALEKLRRFLETLPEEDEA
jgi:XTP/dITP diphosphohydrolase